MPRFIFNFLSLPSHHRHSFMGTERTIKTTTKSIIMLAANEYMWIYIFMFMWGRKGGREGDENGNGQVMWIAQKLY
jgi:hypothetical protein